MKAAVLCELKQPVVVEDIEMEDPKKGEVLVAEYTVIPQESAIPIF